MEIFDTRLFELNHENGHYDFVTSDGINIRQWVTPPKHYVERAKRPGLPYETYKEFHFSNGCLKKSGELFYNFRIGIWKEFDESGKIIKEINEDEPYQFSIENLEVKMRELKVNIMNENSEVRVNRLILENKPVYVITYPVNIIEPDYRIKLLMDATYGKILEKEEFLQIRK